jgi:hypothetical protein
LHNVLRTFKVEHQKFAHVLRIAVFGHGSKSHKVDEQHRAQSPFRHRRLIIVR